CPELLVFYLEATSQIFYHQAITHPNISGRFIGVTFGYSSAGFQAVNELSVSFDDLHLSTNLLEGLHLGGFHRASPVQVKAIPIGKLGSDLIVQAKSGTGKTLVFSIILLESVNPREPHIQAMVISPTREIAFQSLNVIRHLACKIPELNCQLFIGGE
ncbi:unnamed protein product, partial [Protopolystoma xenopodis]